jgi:hypothetical protein
VSPIWRASCAGEDARQVRRAGDGVVHVLLEVRRLREPAVRLLGQVVGVLDVLQRHAGLAARAATRSTTTCSSLRSGPCTFATVTTVLTSAFENIGSALGVDSATMPMVPFGAMAVAPFDSESAKHVLVLVRVLQRAAVLCMYGSSTSNASGVP